MTDKQMMFCHEYMIDRNATQAAIRAGYSKNTAYSQGQRLLKDVEIKKYIDEHTEKLKEKSTVSAQEVLDFFGSVLRKEDESMKNRLKAAELLGKYYSMFSSDRTDKGQEVLDKLDAVLGNIESGF